MPAHLAFEEKFVFGVCMWVWMACQCKCVAEVASLGTICTFRHWLTG